MVLLTHIIDRLANFLFSHSNIQLLDLLFCQLLFNQAIKGCAANFGPGRVTQGSFLLRFTNGRQRFPGDIMKGDDIVVDNGDNGVGYNFRLFNAVR